MTDRKPDNTTPHKHEQSHSCCDHSHNHNHDHNHDHSCCDHDHGHAHKHLSAHDCSALYNHAHRTTDTNEKRALLLEAGLGFAHLGDHTGLATVNATLKQVDLSSTVPLDVAQRNALQALEAAFENKPDKAKLEACVNELEGFQGSEREHIAQLLSDVRKSLAKVRTTGLQGLLNKLKMS